jgi:hypothetical protein
VTVQIADRVDLAGQVYSIAGVAGGPLFDLAAHHIRLGPFSTACWRGYICQYRVDDGALRLQRLVVGDGSTLSGQALRAGSTLLGAALTRSRVLGAPVLAADGLDLATGFTGGLLLGRGFTAAGFPNMGFHPAWRFRKVIELRADHGIVTATADRSGELAAIRRGIETRDIADPDGPRDGAGWVKRTFSLDYSRSFPSPPQ